jgi:4-phosphopantoate--beta-alanine ligase
MVGYYISENKTMKIPESHPRYESLMQRHFLLEGLKKGFVAEAGLIAHGRGEAFDYLLGEKTVEEALDAEKAAVAMLLSAENPVISVNGNTAALVPKGIIEFARLVNARIEINLFYRTLKRERLIQEILLRNGAGEVFGVGKDVRRIPGIDSERAGVDSRGIYSADKVLVPLEDGDRTEALVGMGKDVISIDLNPLSRTSQKATISIVDNVVRAMPNMIKIAGYMRNWRNERLRGLVEDFDNERNLKKIVLRMRKGL